MLPIAAILALMCVASLDTPSAFHLRPADHAQTSIFIPTDASVVAEFAAQELQKHLALITGHTFPIKRGESLTARHFCVGIPAPGDDKPLGNGECRYVITPDAVYLYGEDAILLGSASPEFAIVRRHNLNRTGTLSAVYLFLENELGVRWIEPSDKGICCERRDELVLPVKRERWQSPFRYARGLRTYAWRGSWGENEHVPEAFQLTEEQAQQRWFEDDLWLRRMRLGNQSGVRLYFGHAFVKWWERYGESHPEYFALTSEGKREPISPEMPDRVKMCVSNPNFVRAVVDDWVEKRRANPALHFAVDATENDGGPGGMGQYCHCENCRALDVLLEGEEFGDHLTDRYVHFYNACLAEARKHFPDAQVNGYIYSTPTYEPPRRERVAEGVNLQVVPIMATPFEETRALYEAWQQMGATSLLYRPNDLCVDFGLPMGHEQRIFQAQQLGIEYGAQGFDHDAIYGFWTGVSGINYYIVAKSISAPDKPFEHWEDEYLSAYGPAKEDVRRCYQHWRQMFNERLLPADQEVRKAGGKLLQWRVVGGYGSQVQSYYRPEDFGMTDSYLIQALSRDLSERQRERVQRLVTANQHNRLTYEASLAAASGDVLDQLRTAKVLLDYRIQHQNALQMNWYRLFEAQAEYGLETNSLAKQYDALVARGLNPIQPIAEGENRLTNGDFSHELEDWQVSLWYADKGTSSYEGPDIQIAQFDADSTGKYIRAKIHDPSFGGVYAIHQTVQVRKDEFYVLRFRWRRVNPRESSDFGVVRSERSLQYPRYRLMFRDAQGELIKSLWGAASRRDENTDWVTQARLFSIPNGCASVYVTFFFASEGENHLDMAQLYRL